MKYIFIHPPIHSKSKTQRYRLKNMPDGSYRAVWLEIKSSAVAYFTSNGKQKKRLTTHKDFLEYSRLP
jgi:hypothetical protein